MDVHVEMSFLYSTLLIVHRCSELVGWGRVARSLSKSDFDVNDVDTFNLELLRGVVTPHQRRDHGVSFHLHHHWGVTLIFALDGGAPYMYY